MEKQLNSVLTEHELAEIRALIEARSGIHFDESRERFFSTKIREHMQEKQQTYGAELLRAIRSSNVEYDAFVERLLTQETRFYRYPDVFKAFEKKVLPEIHMKKFWENPRALRVWSAGCATGEEPYSIAISIADSLEFAEAWKINILATDISKQALSYAERGVYPRRVLDNLGGHQIATHFTQADDRYTVKSKLRQMVTFAPMNLAQSTYLGRFDVIFCMNVLIYFTDERRASLIQRFYEYLEPGGYLFLGHADSASGAPVKFDQIIYGDMRLLQKPIGTVQQRSAVAASSEELR
jgi:chemotaxis protein methyltransferase CheR